MNLILHIKAFKINGLWKITFNLILLANFLYSVSSSYYFAAWLSSIFCKQKNAAPRFIENKGKNYRLIVAETALTFCALLGGL